MHPVSNRLYPGTVAALYFIATTHLFALELPGVPGVEQSFCTFLIQHDALVGKHRVNTVHEADNGKQQRILS